MMEELGVMEQSVLNIRLIILQRLFGELKEEELYKAFNLIRCHNKRLSKIGDFSCPLDLQIWQRVLPTIQIPESLNISIEISGIDIVRKVVELPNKYLNIFLKRNIIFDELFQRYKRGLDLEWQYYPRKASFASENMDISVTQVRRQQAEQFANRLVPNCMELAKKKVGPVLDKTSKVKVKHSFLEAYMKFYHVIDLASKERIQDQIGEKCLEQRQRIVQVHVLASAEIQFQLLSPNLNQPAILDESAYFNATFVLYNHARIVQLIKAIPAKRQNRDELINYSLLQEEEEWELAFIYLLAYPSLRLRLVLTSKKEVKSGNLVRFLIALCHCFSRYYNRIHIITTAEHLQPMQCARIELLRLVQKVLEDGLKLLNISLLGIM